MAFVFGYAASSPLIVSPTDTLTQTSLRSSLSAMCMATQIALYVPGRRRLHSAACHLRLVAVASQSISRCNTPSEGALDVTETLRLSRGLRHRNHDRPICSQTVISLLSASNASVHGSVVQSSVCTNDAGGYRSRCGDSLSPHTPGFQRLRAHHWWCQMLPFRGSVVPASSQPAVSTSPGLEGDVSLRRFLYVIVVLSNATNMFRRFELVTEEPTDTSSQLSALKHLRRVEVLFRRTVAWRGGLALIPGKPRVPHCWEQP